MSKTAHIDWRLCACLCLGLGSGLAVPSLAVAQPQVTVSISDAEGPKQVVPLIKVLLALTVLTLAPAILISMTSFTRIVIVFSFVRQALGTQTVPPMQIIMSLSLLLTAVVMAPVAKELDEQVFTPYVNEQIGDEEALALTGDAVRRFILPHTRESDLGLFYELTKTEAPATVDEVALHLLIPAFMISELRTGFEMGFLVFLPFVLIDMIVAAMLTAMGMVMLPPTMMSIPLKLLLFVVVDGWSLLARSVVGSFQ
ncbi:MAG: flagellar type III secretion system pore protein FliP [Myxococcales bacterium]|nr:flagellar type III secretion system pore protein FliP [Myxococcales bacterium]MDD9965688.1 flagellar type III secretion system pore protein FliP [Myxococcales bacterium]